MGRWILGCTSGIPRRFFLQGRMTSQTERAWDRDWPGTLNALSNLQLLLVFIQDNDVSVVNTVIKRGPAFIPLFEFSIEFIYSASPLLPSVFIIKFRYNARTDWLKQRALSEYRCTEQQCHAISPFANFLDFSLGFIYFIIIIFRSRRLL